MHNVNPTKKPTLFMSERVKSLGYLARTGKRYGLAFIGGLPIAVLFAGGVALCFGEKDLPGDDWIILASFIVAWAGAMAWMALAADARQAFRRACRPFMAAAILLPVAAVVFAITEPDSGNPIFPNSFIIAFFFVFGGVLAAIGWLLARYVPRLGDLKFGVVVGALALWISAIAVGFLYLILLETWLS